MSSVICSWAELVWRRWFRANLRDLPRKFAAKRVRETVGEENSRSWLIRFSFAGGFRSCSDEGTLWLPILWPIERVGIAFGFGSEWRGGQSLVKLHHHTIITWYANWAFDRWNVVTIAIEWLQRMVFFHRNSLLFENKITNPWTCYRSCVSP